MTNEETPKHGIAIVGMSGRFPGAEDVESFWRNIRDGLESITFYSDDELRAAGIDEQILDDPAYVKASGALSGIELFDAGFFEYTPREAEMLDPQQRVFLECAWHALEHAGYDPATYAGLIGVYAGSNISTYLLVNLAANPELVASFSGYQTIIANDKDYLPTRVSYKLNLRGPSLNINTACSTSLVAVHVACQSLLNGECDLALAGGVSINVPHRVGYWYREGGISSPDGHCRAFDVRARGTVDGSGVGIIALKRLEDALNDGDTIHAVIRGSAINNDGAHKVGYTAPSVDGQAAVIEEALAVAGVEPDAISYIEAHGTGTPLGDPIEIAALTQVFRAKTERQGFCGVGSVKTNIGHLGAAAGVAGLIKAAQALKHQQIPPSLHFEQPNPKLDLPHSPFYISARLHDWPLHDAPRRAGVSSFGIGGTNAHVVLEAAPELEPTAPGRPAQVLVLSAKTGPALEESTVNLLAYLKQQPDVNLADVAYTLQVGRQSFDHRRMLVCDTVADAIQTLEQMHPARVLTRTREAGARSVVFLFPGQGAQYPNMARELYEVEPKFRATVDRCCELLGPMGTPHLNLDLRDLLFPQDDSAAERLSETWLTQPALFVVEYALARLLMAWGIKPQAMIGHSIGEYVAATISGVFRLDDALALVALRGRMIHELPSGAMLSVPLPEHQVQELLNPELALAAVNGPSLCVVSGTHAAIDQFEQELIARGVDCRRLHTSHAFHSAMMSPILTRFAERVARIERKAPKIPYLSNVTGTWITPQQVADPLYWAQHLRQTVRFAAGLETLLQEPGRILLEVGPGRMLSTFAQQQPGRAGSRIVLSSLRHPTDQHADESVLLNTIGKLWLTGVPVNWPALYTGETRRRMPLPLYPFQRQRYWVEARMSLRSNAAETPQTISEAAPQSEVVAFSLHPRPDLLTALVAPGTRLEQKIADVWQELLGVEPIGIHDDFFELGGHSLMATQVVSRLRQMFQVDLPLERMFETTTIAQLAELIQHVLILKLEALPEAEAQLLLATLED